MPTRCRSRAGRLAPDPADQAQRPAPSIPALVVLLGELDDRDWFCWYRPSSDDTMLRMPSPGHFRTMREGLGTLFY